MKRALLDYNFIIIFSLLIGGMFFSPSLILAQDDEEPEVPKPDRSLLVGGTTVKEGEFIETRIIGYCAMKKAAKTVADEIQNKLNPTGALNTTLVVYNESDVKMLARYSIMMNRLRVLETGYQDIITQLETEIRRIDPTYSPPSDVEIRGFIQRSNQQKLALGPAQIIQSALDVLSLFKTDIELTPNEFDIGEKELVAALFRNLRSFNLYYPKTIPLSVQVCSFNTLRECSPLLSETVKTAALHDRANNLVDSVIDAKQTRRTELNRELNDTNNPPSDARKAQIELEISRIDTQHSRLRHLKERPDISNALVNLNKVYDLTVEELGFKEPAKGNGNGTGETECPTKTCSQTTNVNVNVGDKKEEEAGGGGSKNFISYLQAESLHRVINDQNAKSYWVDLQVVKAGGNLRIKSNIITNFLFGARVNFSGGSIVYYNVFDNLGRSVQSGVVPTYEKYRKSSRIVPQCQ